MPIYYQNLCSPANYFILKFEGIFVIIKFWQGFGYSIIPIAEKNYLKKYKKKAIRINFQIINTFAILTKQLNNEKNYIIYFHDFGFGDRNFRSGY